MAERSRRSSAIERERRALKGRDAPKDLRWWRQDEAHDAVMAQVKRIGVQTRGRRQQDLYFACLYDDAELAQLVQGSQAQGEFTPQTMVTNLVKRQVDTFVAKLAKNKPVPMALTTGGTFTQQRRAKALSKFFEGVLDEVKFWPTRNMRLRDGAIFGSGIAHNYRVGSKIVHERVYPWEIRIDPREAMYGCPRSLYVRRFVDRLVLMERFPEFADEILEADSRSDDDYWDVGWDETSDLVLVVEAWHLPSADPTDKDAKGGAHAICISNATLELSEYRRDKFPFSKFDFSPPVVGWWGEGMAKQLCGLQYEVNAIGLKLQEMGYMTGTQIFVQGDAGIEVDRLDNGTLSVVRCDGPVPQVSTPAPWHPAFFDYYMALRGRMPAEEVRISELSSRGEKPAGLDSGKAIRAYHDIEAEGFTPQGHADEQDTIDTCWQLLDLAEEIQEDDEGEGFKVKTEQRRHGKSVLDEIDFAKVQMDRKEFTLRTFPTSYLNGTPAEKMQSVREMIDAGFLSQDEALALLDFPDLQGVMNLKGAARRNIERILEKILDSDDPEGVYVYPEPAMNLELCRALGLQTYLDAFNDEAPPENLFWVLQFVLDAEELLEGGTTPINGSPEAAQAEAEANMAPEGDMPMPMPGEEALYAPPDGAPMPAGAVAPEFMPPMPQV